jgi:reactive chlorine resistance protein C
MRTPDLPWMATRGRPGGSPHAGTASLSSTLSAAATAVLRYGIVLNLLWFGAFKFTPTEAQGIRPLVANSPFLSWLYLVTDAGGASAGIGVIEIAIAVLIVARPLWPRISAAGSLAAAGMFALTLSFLFTTPGMWATVDGLFVPSGAGGFIVKDLMFFGAALWTAAEALRHRDVAHVRR